MNDEIKMLSVKELNDVLDELERYKIDQEKAYEQYQINENKLAKIDIVYIAGLILYNKQYGTKFSLSYEDDIVERINTINEETGEIKEITKERIWEIRQYFKQYEKLYTTKWGDVFTKFKGLTDKSIEIVDLWSSSFAPILLINEKTLPRFFGNDNIDDLRKIYIEKLLNNDDQNHEEKNYFQRQDNIVKELRNFSPIYTFVFSVAYHKIKPFVDKRGEIKKNQEEKVKLVKQLWEFTKEYCSGLYELAKNIVEHSGQNENDGQGMITIRAYSENETDKTKVLETHIFDYGTLGIIPKLKEYTEKQIDKMNSFENKLSQSQKKVKATYIQDLESLNFDFTLAKLIEGQTLAQQTFRHIGHYGINKLYNLIQHPLEGNMFIASRGMNGKQEYFNENTKNPTFKIGTHYFIAIPFIPENFGKLNIPINKQHEFSTLGSSDALQKLMQKEVKSIQLNELNEYNKRNLDSFTGILDIIVSQKIDKQFVNCISSYFDKLLNYKHKFVVALNLENCLDNESDLLRFLGYLTFEYEQSFIVYNLEFEIYKKMVDDNKVFAETRRWEDFWHEKNAILVYSKTRNRDFYFADILYGKSFNDYYSVNKRLSHTFPNTVSIVDKEIKNADPANNINLFDFFNNNALLPYDILLKNKGKELALFNIKTILQNELLSREKLFNNIDVYNPVELLENYVDNFDGYHISNTHFKIGNKIHSSDFYYAKRLFQNSFYTTRLAMNLAKKIDEANTNKTKPITLIGYEIYSELILSLIEKFLRDDFNYKNISHFIAQSKDDKLIFLPQNIFDEYIPKLKESDRKTFIIVPIAATGSTAKKMEAEISKQYINKTSDEINDVDKDKLFTIYNIILAQDDSNCDFTDIRNINNNQLINLTAKWHKVSDCPLCYGKDKSCNLVETKPLFDTNNSSLTPSLIFGKPIGKTKSKQGNEIENNVVKFDNLCFDNSIEYQRVSRNDNYRVYDVDSDKFIYENNHKIKEWLQKIVKQELKKYINEEDYIVIVAPCHESNTQFINLINENVFSSSATIIHHQSNVDFVENFSMLNESYLTGKNTKIFYVDDSLITGLHFFELFDLIKDVTKEDVTKKDFPLTASIFINDQAVPFIHDRAVSLSNSYFAFTTYNQPPTLNILGKRPLEHERIRYELLQESTLHDTLRKYFHKKSNMLNPEKLEPKENESKEKQIRHLKLFEATHKIYDYFTKNETIPNLKDEDERRMFVDFKLRQNIEKLDKEKENDMNKKALLKVLSQYPFALYKELKQATFEWHKDLFAEISTPNKEYFDIEIDYGSTFSTFKFWMRRAAFLGNYQVLEKDFLEKLLLWFEKIDKYFEQKEKQSANLTSNKERNNDISNDLFSALEKVNKEEEEKELKKEEENLRDFPIFVLGNYVEMIQKNGWVAYHIFKNINSIKGEFEKSNQGRQFLSMLQIEAATVIDDFMKMINKDYRFKWRDMYKIDDMNKNKELDTDTVKIKDFFKERVIDLNKTNKYSVVKETFLNNSDIWEREEFVNFLWIKQLLYADSIDENSYLPKEIDYQKKIDEIIEKMKNFFHSKENVEAFFIVTDGQEIPYVQCQRNYILSEFKKYYVKHKKECEKIENEIKKFKKNNLDTKGKENELKQLKENPDNDLYKFPEFIKFLNGIDDTQSIAYETTAEYQCKNGQWKNIYNGQDVNLDFMPSNTRWLYLIRISELKENKKNSRNKFIAQGLLGFYSEKTELAGEILPKQLLMLLRKDISTFIKKHHKNDEFSKWVFEKEKADSQFMRLHSIGIYDSAINYYKNMIEKEDDGKKNTYINYFCILETWLAGRILLLRILDKEEISRDEYNYETFKIEEFINNICKNYKYTLSFHNTNFKFFSDTNINAVDTLVELSYNNISDSDKNINVTYLKKLKEQIIFEVFYNIR
jgi:hypothetical protein